MSAGAQGWLPNLAFLPTQVGEEGAAGGAAVAAADGDAEATGQDELVLLHGGDVRKIRPVALVAAQEDSVRDGFQQGGGRGGDQLLAVRQHHARFAQDALEEEHVCDRHIARTVAAPKVLDTSAIIDGRFFDVYKTGIIEGIVMIPQFVLDELRHIADSTDSVKRVRGRRGLDMLQDIQNSAAVQSIAVYSRDYPDIAEVDAKLLRFASEHHAMIVTTDYNLNKVATVQKVPVFNINDLANALRSSVAAGEDVVVDIVKEGKEFNQGVAYFNDGTMVVVDGAKRYVGKSVTATVTSVLQTSAGKMVFAKLREE